MSAPGAPRVTVITAVLNGAGQIERAMRSVFAQTHAPLDYVVIDGGSTDGTLATIERYRKRLAHFETGPDGGISDAFNRGLAVAKGDFVQFLNADDWLEPEQIQAAVSALGASGADFAFGDLVYHAPRGEPVHRVFGDPGYAHRLRVGMPDVNHPTLLARRQIYDRIGGFDPTLRYTMDYDWLLRADAAGFRGVYAPEVVGHMTLGGAADRHWRRALVEVMQVSRRHGCPGTTAVGLLLWRLGKGAGRRALERALPGALPDVLRRLTNPRLSKRIG